MKLIVGLGNPGPEYAGSRHNFGFMVLDHLAKNFKVEKKLQAEISRTAKYLYAKPLTFMNDSGVAVGKIAKFYKIKSENIIVIYDDKDLPFGTIRIRTKGSSGGHNGVASIIQNLSTENFLHFRLGTANPRTAKADTVKFVMSNFTASETKQLPAIIAQAKMEIDKICK